MGRVEDIYMESTFGTANKSPRNVCNGDGHRENRANGNYYPYKTIKT